jgi:hypothetical protein
VNHLSHITNDAHFNEFLERYENLNTISNQNSTEVGLIAYTNHLQSFTDNDFVNSLSSISNAFSFQPPYSSLPSTYKEKINISSPKSFHTMLPLTRTNDLQQEKNTNENLENTATIVNDSAPLPVKKRGRPPLSAEVIAQREATKQAAKRAKLLAK